MKKIRKGVFETNSSSTHSICIAKDTTITLPKNLHFEFGEFGWEYDTLYSIAEKASYLYTGLIANSRNEDADRIFSFLKDKGVDVTFESGQDVGYIDHSGNLTKFLNDICSDNDKLLRFLFSDLSFIITGNDNSEHDVDINVSYDCDEYYKGN